jgi:hypothetical protein
VAEAEAGTNELSSSAAQSRSSTRRDRLLSWIRRSWVPLVLVVASLAMTGAVTASHTAQFSPYDEWVYYDYVTKVPEQFVVHQGEDIGPAALEAMACDGDTFGPRGEPCGGPYVNPAAYPQSGKTSADLYTPVYFVITWGLAQIFQFALGLDLLTAARLTGFFWLAGGMWLFASLMSKFRVPRLVTLGLGVAFIGSPIAAFTFTYITTDSPGFLVGALTLLATVRFVRGEGSGWWLVPISIFALALKVTNLVIVGLMLVFLIIYALSMWRRRDELAAGVTRVKLIVVGFLATLSGMAGVMIWLAIRSAIKISDQPDQGLVEEVINLRTMSGLTSTFFPGPFGLTTGPLTIPASVAQPFVWLAIAGVIGFLFQSRRGNIERSLSIALAVAVTLFAPLMLIGMYIVLGAMPPVSGRYSAGLVPAMLLATGMIMRNGIARWGVLIYGIGMLVVELAYAFRAIMQLD